MDLSCGTGSQVFWLNRQGFKVVGTDINAKMLKIAKSKAKKVGLDIPFIEGDMRTQQLGQVGQVEAVITIFNAIGHLTKQDFIKTLRNTNQNLKKGGIYIFDICNLNYLLQGSNISSLTIDWQYELGIKTMRVIQCSTISQDGVLASYTTCLSQSKSGKVQLKNSVQTLQIYTAKQLKEMLHQTGFKVVRQCGVDGSKLKDKKTERIITVARKTLG